MELLVLMVVGVVLILPVVAMITASLALNRANRALSRLAEMGVNVAPSGHVPGATAAAEPEPGRQRPVASPAVAASPVVAAPPASPESVSAVVPPNRDALPTARAGPAPPPSLEERIGVTWFTRIGAGVLLLGAAYFFKYAVDNQWIGPWARVAIGSACGVVVLFLAERLKGRARAAYVNALYGVSIALLYVSGYAAYGFYRLVPLPLAFLSLAIVALLGGALALASRSQAVLILSLTAAFANPVLLSTGEDHPVALFAYLLLVTSAALSASLRLGAAAAAWLAMLGTAVLATGWYGEFFTIAAPARHPVTGAEVAGSAGAYWPLLARGVPLGFLAAFAAQWIALAVAARRRAWERVGPTPVLLAGLLLLEIGHTALLPDRPTLLAGVMVVCAFVSLAFLRGSQTPLATLPLLAAFLALASRTDAARSEPWWLLALSVVALAVYAATFLVRSHRLEDRLSAVALHLFTVTAAMAVLFAALLLLPLHPRALAATALAVGGAAALVGGARGRAGVAAGAGLASAVVLLIAAPAGIVRSEPSFLPLVALWGGVYLAFGAHHLVVERRSVTPLAVVTTCGGPLAFVAVVLLATSTAAGGLRALCAAAAAAALFVLGAALLRRRPEARDAASVFLGLGLALLALAVALAFSGVTITLVWALLGATVVAVAVAWGDERWLVGGAALLALAVGRLLVIDATLPGRELARFAATGGREGAPFPVPLLNPRALALAGVAAALLFAASRCAAGWRRTAAVLAVTGYAALLALAIVEVRAMVTTLPAAAPSLPADEIQAWLGRCREAVRLQAGRRAVSATLVMGGFGAALLGAGFASRSVLHRWLGLSALGATVGKLALWDIWQLPRLSRVLVLLGVGTLLLGAGFLYARFGNRLLGFLRGGAALLTALLLAPAALALDLTQFTDQAAIEVGEPGYNVIPVPPDLYRRSRRPPSLADLRIVDSAGTPVPWFLRDVPTGIRPMVLRAELLDPVTLLDGASRATFDLGEGGVRHNEIVLRIGGDNFIRECELEVSDDRRGWAAIATGRIFRATVGTAAAEHSSLRYPTSAARYLRVTVEGTPGEDPVAIAGGEVRLRTEEAPEPITTIPLNVARSEHSANRRISIVTLDAGGAGVPLRALLVKCSAGRFLRRVTVEAASSEGNWAEVGAGVLFRAGERAEAVRIPVATAKRYLRLLIHEGDNRPLPVAEVRGEYRLQELVFAAASLGTHTLYLGADELGQPVYDIGQVLARAPDTPTSKAVLRSLQPNPVFRAAGPPPSPWTERFRVPIAVALAAALVALAVFAVRLLQRARDADG